MLHSYAFSNFRSFRRRAEVSLVLNEKDSANGWVVNSATGQRLTTALAVLGPNASGKTSLLQPLAFLAWFVPHSFGSKPGAVIPIKPHFASKSEPTDFEFIVDAIEPQTLWRYRVSLTTHRVISESLERKQGRGRWQRIFDRQSKGEDGYEVQQNEFGLDPAQAAAVRPNVSLISWAVQFDVELAKQLCEISVITNINSGGRISPRGDVMRRLAKFYGEEPELQQRMKRVFQDLDFGLEDIVAREADVSDASGNSETQKVWVLFGLHKGTENYLLPFTEESSGTKAAFTLLAQFIPALEQGGFVVYDELESDLHPMMIAPLLGLFSDPAINKNNAQIIFTCHSPEVLRFLQKSQVILVEKRELESRAWRLDSVSGVRSDDNRVAKYLAGVYGAVPRVTKRLANES